MANKKRILNVENVRLLRKTLKIGCRDFPTLGALNVLVHKWYEVASRFEKSRQELAKAQKSFDHFQNQFEIVGKNLGKAQEAFDKASTHLKTYRGRVSALSGQEQLELDTAPAETLPLIDKASA
jgi:DNA anti-recombination protein RmuC